MPIDPSSLSGKMLWLRAKDNGADGTAVTSWADQSGVGFPVTVIGGTAPVVADSATPAGGKAVRYTAGAGLHSFPSRFKADASSVPAGSSGNQYAAANAFDRSTVADPSTVWASGTMPAWLRIFGPPKVVTSYRFMPTNANYPTAWTFEGSNDGTAWTVLDTRTGQTGAGGAWSVDYTFTNTTSYSWYRFNFTGSNGTLVNLAEVQFNGQPNPAIDTVPGEVWAVVKVNAAAGTKNPGPFRLATSSYGGWYPYSDGVVYQTSGSDFQHSFTPSVPVTSWRLFRITTDGINWKAFLDNAQVASVSNHATWAIGGAGTLGGDTVAGATLPSSGAGAYDIAEFLVLDRQLTTAEVADLVTYFNTEHGLSVPGGSAPAPNQLSGTVAATSGAQGDLAVSASLAGQVDATSNAQGSVAANAQLSGQVDALSDVQGVFASGVSVQMSGQVDAVSDAQGDLSLAFQFDGQVDAVSNTSGDVTSSTGFSGQVDAVSTVQGSVNTATLGADVVVGVGVEVGPLTLLNLKALPGVEVEVGGRLEVGDSQSVVPLPGVTIPVGASVDARPVDLLAVDPRHKRAQWNYRVAKLDGTVLGELSDLQHDPVEDAIGEAATMQFTMPASGDQFALVKPIETQLLVWEGDVLRLRGPILPGQPSDDGSTITYKVHDPSWFWREGRRVITRIPQKNLLKNGDFRQGLTYWSRGYDKDSLPKAAPTVKVVTDDFAMDSDGLDPIRAAEIEGVESFTQSELSSNAVFYPNLAKLRPGGKAAIEAVANAMPATVGLKVSVVGHTANDHTGNGLELSARRAEVAKDIIHAKRPGAVITTKGVGLYDPKPGFPEDSQEQRRVVIGYNQTISGKSLQWMRQTLEVTHPKSAKYGLELTAAWMLKVADAWSVEDANMMSGRLVARRKSTPKKIYDESNASISDTDPVDRWIPQTTSVTIPADGRTYTVDLYLYAPAAVARYTAVGLWPEEKLFFWGADQATIFRGVMEHIQKPEYGYADLGVGVRAPSTGVLRDREFAFRELIPADTALDGLTAISRGIEWDTLTTATTTTAAAFYPRQGKTVDYVLALGGNVAAASPANTRDVGSQVIAQAQDLGSYRAMAYASDRRAFGGTLIQRVVTAEQDTPLNELGAAAKAELFWSRSSTPAYWVDIDPDSISDVLANTRKGDTVRLILDGAFNVDAQARIVRRQIHPDSLRLMLAFEEA